jgi:PAS domain S-box-containing protein
VKPKAMNQLILQLMQVFASNMSSEQMIDEALRLMVNELDIAAAGFFFEDLAGTKVQVTIPATFSFPWHQGVLKATVDQMPQYQTCIEAGGRYLVFSLSGRGFLGFAKATDFEIGSNFSDFANYIIAYSISILEQHRRYQIERQWKDEIALYKQIINAIPEMLAYKDIDSIYRVANKVADQTFLHRFPTIVGHHVNEIYPEAEVDIIQKLDEEAIHSPTPVRKEVVMMTDSGFIEVETVRVPVDDIEGNRIGIISMSRDISERKRIDAKLSRVVSFQKILMDIATHFINVPEQQADEAINRALQMAGEYIAADRVYVFDYLMDERIMNNTHEWCAPNIIPQIDELQGVPMDDFVDNWVEPHMHGNSVYIPDVAALDPNDTVYQILTPQGVVSVLTIPLYYHGRVLGFVGFDAVTEKRVWGEDDQTLLKVLAELIVNLKIRQEKQHELTVTRDKAERANEAKGEFLANMSHEIRTPLSGIYNALYLLYNTSLSPEQQEYIDIANSSIESLSGIVNNILDLSKIEAGKLELNLSSFDLEEELFQIAKMQEYSAIEKGLKLRFEYDYSIPTGVRFDRLRLRQIILNLLNNAIKYTEHGEIRILAHLESRSKETVAVRFSIIDTGIGIKPELLPIITEKFVQGDSSATKKYAGTGLGLAIVKYLVEWFGGTLKIESVVGKGSAFSFVLKFARDEAYPAHDFSKLYGMRALLMGSDDPHVENTKRFLKAMGLSIDVRWENASSQPHAIYDYLIYDSDLDRLEPTRIDQDIAMFGTSKVKTILCSPEPLSGVVGNLKDKHIDFALAMPITRSKVYQTLVLGGKNQAITETPIPETWSQTAIFSGIRVLVVDDNRINRQALELILKRAGFIVTLAQNGYEAIELVQKHDFDLILMDIQMPGIDGFETAETIKKLPPSKASIPIIAVTANALPSARERAFQVGMLETITKPIKTDLLFHTVDLFVKNQIKHGVKAKEIAIPVKLQVFHETDFKARFEGVDDLADQIIRALQDDYQGDLSRIREAANRRDAKTLRSATHYFKGSAAYVSAERVVWLCQAIIDLANRNELEDIDSLVDALFVEVDKWLKAVRSSMQQGVIR